MEKLETKGRSCLGTDFKSIQDFALFPKSPQLRSSDRQATSTGLASGPASRSTGLKRPAPPSSISAALLMSGHAAIRLRRSAGDERSKQHPTSANSTSETFHKIRE
jgi:hypothetical protein